MGEVKRDDRRATRRLRVLVGTDDAGVRRALQRILAVDPNLDAVSVIGGPGVDREALIALTRNLRPQALILAVHDPVDADVALATALHAAFPALCLIGITKRADPSAHVEAACAFAFLIGARRLDFLTQALHECLSELRGGLDSAAA